MTHTDPLKVLFKVADPRLRPVQATPLSAGVDLKAAAIAKIAPGEKVLISTGLWVQIPAGWEGQIRSRSGLALKNGVVVFNSPGTIDADYRGEIKVILANTSTELFLVEFAMRIAQLVICPVPQVFWQETETLEQTLRGNGGFGSTGLL
ncbi:MAG: deoxyuridine 5'-triphosphate nucleotidohydrolase [Alphaproteobacteria bacterium 40-19]|nr:MAG: deoxyuridine 5'-triphosphate nucleotidohydrolase [Alphaproteobacteria bacterium 40-19]